MTTRKIKANKRTCRTPTQMWLIVSTIATTLTFCFSLGAIYMDNWFEIYCENDYNDPIPRPSYSVGLWKYCGRDVSWVGEVNSTQTVASNWECVDVNTLFNENTKPTWLQGSRSMHVSGCIASGLTLLLMIVHYLPPEHLAQGGAAGFAGASLASAAFFTCTLLTVFAVQNRGSSLVPPECGVPYIPSSYPITLIAGAVGTAVYSALITGLVSEGLIAEKPIKKGSRIVREVEQ